MKKISIILASLLFIIGCSKEEEVVVITYKISTPASNSLKIGETKTIKVTITPIKENVTDLVWKSSNTDVLSVNNTGTIKGLKEGEATITVSSKSLNSESSTKVTVLPIKAENITLNKTEISLEQGKFIRLQATITPNNTTNKTVKWETSDGNIATVSDSGNINAKKEGSCEITASIDDKKAICKVTVTPIKVTSISLTNANIEIMSNLKILDILVGKSEQITATILPNNAKNKNITWTSSNPSLVSVDSKGMITALQPSEDFVKITAITEDGNKTDVVRVSPKTIEGFMDVSSGSSITSLNNNYLTGNMSSTFINQSKEPIKIIGFTAIFNKNNIVRLSTPLNVILKPTESIEKGFNVVNEYKPNYRFIWWFMYKGKEHSITVNSSPKFQ